MRPALGRAAAAPLTPVRPVLPAGQPQLVDHRHLGPPQRPGHPLDRRCHAVALPVPDDHRSVDVLPENRLGHLARRLLGPIVVGHRVPARREHHRPAAEGDDHHAVGRVY
jgi:hypothetical protein